MKYAPLYIFLAFVVGAIAGGFVVHYAIGTQLIIEQVPATSATDTAQIPIQVPTAPATTTTAACQALTVLEPQPGAGASSPISVRAIVDNRNSSCHWTVFEAQAGSVVLQDPAGNILGQAPLKTTGDWTSSDPLEYDANVSLSKPYTGVASLVITEEDPSGKPNPQTVSIGISLN
ncbi:MAG: hypothetical protein WA001_01680 [Patescibacteria group bacterium]